MKATLTAADLVRMVASATQKIRASNERLSALDSAIGDGDHGMTMLRAMELADAAATSAARSNIGQLLDAVGWAVMGIDGGATGPLLATLLLGMGEAADGRGELDAGGVAAMFRGGLTNLRTQTQAKVGDKTMVDALVPAIDALEASARRSPDIAVAMRNAASAAQAGAEATANMQARFGRAKHLGDRTLGHPDPGAISMAILFAAFAEALSAPN